MDAPLARALAAFVACVACAHAPKCPARGGPAWWEVTTDHFVLIANRPEAQARRAAARLEQMRTAYLLGAWQGVDPPMPRLRVVAFRDLGELSEFTGTERFLGFTTRLGGGESLLTTTGNFDLDANPVANDGSVFKHELAHWVDGFFLIRPPRWLDEGLAMFLETMTIDKHGQATLGAANLGRLPPGLSHSTLAGRTGWLPMADVLGAKRYPGAAWKVSSFYSMSWLFVHMLVNERGTQFTDYQRRLGHGDDPDKAFARAFPGVTADFLDDALWNYFGHGRFARRTFAVPKWPGHLEARQIADAEVHAVWAQLHWHFERERADALLEASERSARTRRSSTRWR